MEVMISLCPPSRFGDVLRYVTFCRKVQRQLEVRRGKASYLTRHCSYDDTIPAFDPDILLRVVVG